MQTSSEIGEEMSKSASKPPVIRNARACTVCRAAKMKCVGAEDGQKQCQRCKRTNSECVFEKHRRGRKPGSKLSEASKMLRRLEKGLNAAKLKQMNETCTSPVFPPANSRSPQPQSPFGGILRSGDQYGSSGSRPSDGDDEEDGDRCDEKFPAKMIRRENSFFRTILNPEHKSPYPAIVPQAPRNDTDHQQSRPPLLPDGCKDPITAGLITEDKARILLDLIMLRLNPFINLFDPALHSVEYVRSKCPFLFTTLIMAGSKFFQPEIYKECLRLAHDLAVYAFSKAWKRVEVVQAFACLTYWREQEDNRTWMYIGYACRMAVELGLNRFVTKPPVNETEIQLRERRNRERTYLVLFVHDRSLSIQTGRLWMLPEDDFIRHADMWHTHGCASTRCQDVIVAAFTQLRRTAAETTDMLHTNRSLVESGSGQANVDMVLKNANLKLSQWSAKWEHEMQKANGEPFHFSFLSFFRLYTSLFLNSLGVQDTAPQANRTNSHLRALSACFENALKVLRIASKEFRDLSVLQYGQETTTVMTAYSAIFLLRLLRNAHSELPESAANEIHEAITRTAEAYNSTAQLSPTSSTASYHARFLWHLISMNRIRPNALHEEIEHDPPLDPAAHRSTATIVQPSVSSPHDMRAVPPFHYPSHTTQGTFNSRDHPNSSPFFEPTDQIPAITDFSTNTNHYTLADFAYYRNMLFDLGFGDNDQVMSTDHFPAAASYGEGINAHYGQFTYPPTQAIARNEFTGS